MFMSLVNCDYLLSSVNSSTDVFLGTRELILLWLLLLSIFLTLVNSLTTVVTNSNSKMLVPVLKSKTYTDLLSNATTTWS